MNVNTVLLTGRLTKDLELKESQKGKKYVNFTLAVNGYNNHADFFDITVFNGAEFLTKYAKKGDLIFVAGSLRQQKWVDKDNERHEKIMVIAQSVELLAKKRESVSSETQSDEIPF